MAGEGGLAGAAGALELATQEPIGAPPRRGIERVDEPLGLPDRPEFEPRGTGVEGSTDQGSNQELIDFAPARGSVYLLDEVAVSIEGNGAATISLNGDLYGEFSGALEVLVPFNGAVLPYGGHVRVLHRSTDGSSTTTRAQVSGREL